MNTNNERVIEVVLDDGTLVSDGLLSYEVPGAWLLPLDEFSTDLGLSLKVSAALSRAEGFILKESRPFRLDLKECEVEFEKFRKTLPNDNGECQGATSHGDEIYVDTKLLSEWFPIELTVEPFSSRVIVHPREKLPLQLRRDRKSRSDALNRRNSNFDPGYPRAPETFSLADGPFWDQQLSFSREKLSQIPGSTGMRSDSSFSGELLGLETRAFASAERDELKSWRLNLARRDPEGKLLGPLGATEISFLDVTFPQLPLINATRTGRGFLLSSYPLTQPSRFGVEDFRGTILPDWEVELYQNGILIDRKMADTSGQYAFERIPLFYGDNQFKFVFFGPQGQQRTEYKSYKIEPNTTLPFARNYRLSVIEQDTVPNATLQVEQSLHKNVTASLGLVQLTLPDEQHERYGYLGMLGFADNVLLAGSFATSQNGGKAVQARSQFPFQRMAFGTRYTRLFNFQSDLFNSRREQRQKNEAQMDLTLSIPSTPAIGMTWEAIQKNFEGDYRQTLFNNRISTLMGKAYLNHFLSYTMDNAPVPVHVLNGKLDLNYLLSLDRLRLGLEYNRSEVQAAETEAQLRLSRFTATGVFRHDFVSGVNQIRGNFSRAFDALTMGSTLAVDNAGAYSFSILLNFSLIRDSSGNQWQPHGEPQSNFGAASLFAFRDRNFNGIHDDGEPGIKGVGVRVNQRDDITLTEESGRAFIPRLQSYTPTDVSVAIGSVEDPMVRPSLLGMRFTPRPGKTTLLPMPFVPIGEIDGRFEFSDAMLLHSRHGLVVNLLDLDGRLVKTAKSDRDGNFFLEDILPGTYDLMPDPETLDEFNMKVLPPLRRLMIPDEGGIKSDMEFLLYR